MLRERLRASSALRTLRFLPYAVPYTLLRLVTRPRRSRVLFLSDSHAGFTGNMEWVRRELARQRPGTRVTGVFKPSLRARRPLRDVLRLPYLMATSGVIVVDDFYPLIYELPLRRGTRLVQLWHAAGAFKRVGHSRAGLPGGPTPGSRIHRNYTDAYVSSEGIRSDYAEAYGIDRARVRALGVPRTDFFFDDDALAAARARVRDALGVRDDERLAVFAPTFRGNGQLSAYVDESADWAGVARDLGPGWRVAVRRHPFTERAAGPLPEGLLDAGDGLDMNDVLAAADVLVTDYSSAVFEFALLRRPIVLFAPDLEEYTSSRAFYRPFEAYATGPVVRDPDRLAEAIGTATVDDEALDRFLAEFCGMLDGHSSERIAADIADGRAPETPKRSWIQALRLDLAAAYAARFALGTASRLMRVLPRRRKITMITREHKEPPLDFVLLERAIRHEDADVEITTIARMVPPGIVGKAVYAFHLLAELYHVATSRVLIIDGYSVVASAARHGSGLTVVQLWHALGSLKKFGLSILGRPEGRDPRIARAMRMHRNYDVVVASAEICREPYAEAFGVDPERVMIAPLPRVDYLRDDEVRRRARERFRTLYPDLSGRPIALFAPTFRTDGTSQGIDPLELTARMRDIGYATITKLHPILRPLRSPDLRVAPGMSTQELLLVADVFITDYSSAVFEAAVAGVPSYLLAPDLDSYTNSRDFYVDYPQALGLTVAATADELASHVAAGTTTAEAMARMRDRFVQLPPNGSRTSITERLAAAVVSYADVADPADRAA
ncbi:CDP-glycerol glycerophosphotransferase family protein [Microbacter sp. GSS18]|nr:CDP-glycerol glycerophosphotransferase family protein [Microbacter sp. GSS18]